MPKGVYNHKPHSKETKEKMSESRIGRVGYWLGKIRKPFSIKTRKKMSIAAMGNKRNLGNHLSEETKLKLSISKRGKNNPAWKGGITTDNHSIRVSSANKLWRKAILTRDNFTCQKTGISGGDLHTHHINNFADFPELRFNINNGITLSKKSHNEFHKIYGKKNNTLEQVLEFIKTNGGKK